MNWMGCDIVSYFYDHHLFFTQLLECKLADENVNSVVDSFHSCIGK